MAEARTPRSWLPAAAFAAMAAAAIFLRILPLPSVPGGLPGPDLVFVAAAALVLRRPERLPVVLIAAVVVIEDLLLLRPPGLWAALVVLASEFLRTRAALVRALPFAVEWMLAGTVIAAAMLAERLVLGLTGVPQPPLGPAAVHLVATLASYPVVVALLQAGFGLRKVAPGAADERGRPL